MDRANEVLDRLKTFKEKREKQKAKGELTQKTTWLTRATRYNPPYPTLPYPTPNPTPVSPPASRTLPPSYPPQRALSYAFPRARS